jgi:hypothetical protein
MCSLWTIYSYFLTKNRNKGMMRSGVRRLLCRTSGFRLAVNNNKLSTINPSEIRRQSDRERCGHLLDPTTIMAILDNLRDLVTNAIPQKRQSLPVPGSAGDHVSQQIPAIISLLTPQQLILRKSFIVCTKAQEYLPN